MKTLRPLTLALVVTAAGPAGSLAQTPCSDGRVVGAIGVGGVTCRDCTLSLAEGAVVRARFGTEPEITRVRGSTALQRGDVLVAVDGSLITTRAGSDRLTSLRPGETVAVRVRRDGVERDLRITTTAACLRPAPDAPKAPSPAVAVAPPRAPTAEGAARPSVAVLAPPAPPAIADMRPNARLGFGFSCEGCAFDGERWTFDEYPRVFRVEPDGPADGRLEPDDEVRAVNGADLRTPAGSRAFTRIEPGQRVVWTVQRAGREIEVVTRADDKPQATLAAVASAAPAASPAAPTAPAAVAGVAVADVLRYAGTFGSARVEVRGEPVTVTTRGNVLVIRTRGNEIRVELPAGSGSGG